MSQSERWYKDAIIYQLRIRSFNDSDGDGIGDIQGVTERLDYLQDLGVTAIWLLPFYPSPLRDDGYDISDYTDIHPDLGTLTDFRKLLREAHRRGLRVITELVMNHTSDHHPWFERARRAPPGSRARDFYVWSDTVERYADARIIFKDFETSNWAWDPIAKAHYWHRFYSHQPDLNFDNPAVRRAMFRTLDFWFRMGVDGVRLDAVPYLYERTGTSCENLPETHGFLRELRAHMDTNFPDRMLLAEANQWPEDAVAYFGKGDECHMAFHFPIMPRLFMALHQEDRHPILDILDQTPSIPDSAQWAIFLRNHDELTLEMVTDEERDYMWRVYAPDQRARINLGIRHRLAPLLDNSRRRIELMNALLVSLPGTPIVYYGDEIGMGDNIYLSDRDSVRTPMQWSPDRNAGFSKANPQRLFLPVVSDPEYSPESVNVEVQERNTSSLLWFMKRMLRLRQGFRAFGRGSFEPLVTSNRAVFAFLRRYQDQRILIVANLSRFPQFTELDLSDFEGAIPIELFGRTKFPPIGELPYLLTIGPHGFYWFVLEDPAHAVPTAPGEHSPLPEIVVRDAWEAVLEGAARRQLESQLPTYLVRQRWFRSKAREIRSCTILDAVPVEDVRLAIVRVTFASGEPEDYVLPLRHLVSQGEVDRAVARVEVERDEGPLDGFLVDATRDRDFQTNLLEIARRGRRPRGDQIRMTGDPASVLRRLGRNDELPAPSSLAAEQTNTSWRHGDRLVGKLFRLIDTGASPELDIVRHLSERVRFPNVPGLAGHIEIHRPGAGAATLAIFQTWVPNEGDAWTFTLEKLERLFSDVLRTESFNDTETGGEQDPAAAVEPLEEHLESYAELANLLGQRTGELHGALSTDAFYENLTTEIFTPFARRGYAQSVRNLAVRALELLAGRLGDLTPENRALADRVLARRRELEGGALDVMQLSHAGRIIRCHGDYHLGQVLYTGSDFVILDFEGEPARTLAERRRKRSPFADVAGMLRSFHYALEFVLGGEEERTSVPDDERHALEPWGERWHRATREAFLSGYFQSVRRAEIVPEGELGDRLLRIYLLEKALYELAYEINNRPSWVGIPLRGILEVLERDTPE